MLGASLPLQQGLIPDMGTLLGALNEMQASYQSVASASAATLAAANLLGGILVRSGGAALTDTTDTAANIIAALPNARVGQTFLLIVANLNSGTLTLAGGTGVTLSGTTTVATVAMRVYVGAITGLGTNAAVTLQGCFQMSTAGAAA